MGSDSGGDNLLNNNEAGPVDDAVVFAITYYTDVIAHGIIGK